MQKTLYCKRGSLGETESFFQPRNFCLSTCRKQFICRPAFHCFLPLALKMSNSMRNRVTMQTCTHGTLACGQGCKSNGCQLISGRNPASRRPLIIRGRGLLWVWRAHCTGERWAELLWDLAFGG